MDLGIARQVVRPPLRGALVALVAGALLVVGGYDAERAAVPSAPGEEPAARATPVVRTTTLRLLGTARRQPLGTYGSPTSWAPVWSGLPDRSFWRTTGNLGVGYAGPRRKVGRTYLRFDTRAIRGKTILGAELNLRQVRAASCQPHATVLYRTGAISNRTTWRRQPARYAVQGVNTSTYGCGPDKGMVGWDATEAATHFAQTGAATGTFLLRARGEIDPKTFKQFTTEYGGLFVTYVSEPDVPTNVRIGLSSMSAPCGTEASPTAIGSTSVNLAARLTSADGNNAQLTGVFRLRDTALAEDDPDVEGTATVSEGSSTLTRQVLDGHVYRFQVRARSSWSYNGVPGSMDSAPTAWCWFAVDMTP